MDQVARIADAVLYEGYLLWPYRSTAIKNQRRWTFGGVYPARHSEAHPDDRSEMQTQCLVEGGAGCTVEVRVRFLHVVERNTGWQEATEREVGSPPVALDALANPIHVAIDVPAGHSDERSWRALSGSTEIAAVELAPDLHRLTVRIGNTSPFEAGDREQALKQTFCSTHTILHVDGGAFVSLTDPPEALRAEAERCENVGTWPVLVGENGERHTVLSSPIILPDYPEIAPESQGDLFDATEIDQLLTLSILTLTEEEKREVKATDPKAREILERTESLTEDELMRMHGMVRELGLRRR